MGEILTLAKEWNLVAAIPLFVMVALIFSLKMDVMRFTSSVKIQQAECQGNMNLIRQQVDENEEQIGKLGARVHNVESVILLIDKDK